MSPIVLSKWHKERGIEDGSLTFPATTGMDQCFSCSSSRVEIARRALRGGDGGIEAARVVIVGNVPGDEEGGRLSQEFCVLRHII